MSLPAEIKTLYNTFNQSGGITFSIFPVTAAGSGLASGKVWVWGAWVDVLLAAAMTVNRWLVGALFLDLTLTADEDYLAQIGTGTAPAGTSVAEFGWGVESGGVFSSIQAAQYIPIPRRIAAATGIVARITGANNANSSAAAKVVLAAGL